MLRKDVETTSKRVEEVRTSSGLEQLEEEVRRLETAAADDSFWDDRSRAQQILMALNDVKDKIKLLTEIKTQVPNFFSPFRNLNHFPCFTFSVIALINSLVFSQV